MPIVIKHGGSYGLPAGLAAAGGFVQGFGQKQDDMKEAAMKEAAFQTQMQQLQQQMQIGRAKLAMMPMEQRAMGQEEQLREAQIAQAQFNLSAALKHAGADEAGAQAIHAFAAKMFQDMPDVVDALSRSTSAEMSMNILNTTVKAWQAKRTMELQQQNSTMMSALIHSGALDTANENQKKAIAAAAGDPQKLNQALLMVQAEAMHNDGLGFARDSAVKTMQADIDRVSQSGGLSPYLAGSAQRLTALSKLVGQAKHATSYEELSSVADQFTSLVDPARVKENADEVHATIDRARAEYQAMRDMQRFMQTPAAKPMQIGKKQKADEVYQPKGTLGEPPSGEGAAVPKAGRRGRGADFDAMAPAKQEEFMNGVVGVADAAAAGGPKAIGEAIQEYFKKAGVKYTPKAFAAAMRWRSYPKDVPSAEFFGQ